MGRWGYCHELLGAVAVVNIPIDNQHSGQVIVVKRKTGGDHNVIQQAESHGSRPAGTGPAPGSHEVLVLLDALPSLTERDRMFGRAWKQRAAFETVDSLGGEATVSTLRTTHGYSRSVLNGLAERGVAKFETRKRLRDPFSSVETVASPPSESTVSLWTGTRC